MLVLPYIAMASLITKRKGKQAYYYVVTSQRVNGQPRIVQQIYLGKAERLARLVRNATQPVPLSATSLDLGLPGALWQAALSSGAFAALQQVWPPRGGGPSVAHHLLLAAFHRICAPGPKTQVAAWYDRTVLRRLWGFPSSAFTSQAFWDCFDSLEIAQPTAGGFDEGSDDLLQAQDALLAAFRERDLVSSRVLAYDTTNFHTWIATGNDRCTLAQRGHTKQKRNDLRQVGLSYALDGEHGLSLMHHVYRGNVADSQELPVALDRIGRSLDRAGIPRATVTLVLDKGSAGFAHTQLLAESGLGWVAALPWNQAPPALRDWPDDRLEAVCSAHPGVRAACQRHEVQGGDYLGVLQHSATYAAEQLRSVSDALAKATQFLRRLAREVARPPSRATEAGLRRRIEKQVSRNYLPEVLRYELTRVDQAWRLTFEVDQAALQRLIGTRFGRTVVLTNRRDWSVAQVVDAYGRQQQIERVFRGLKGGGWVGWSPLDHWTDSKIKVHAFYSMLGVSLLHYLHRKAEAVWPGLTLEGLVEELREIRQFELLYPNERPKGQAGKPRVATVSSKRTLIQRSLAEALEVDGLLAEAAPASARG